MFCSRFFLFLIIDGERRSAYIERSVSLFFLIFAEEVYRYAIIHRRSTHSSGPSDPHSARWARCAARAGRFEVLCRAMLSGWLGRRVPGSDPVSRSLSRPALRYRSGKPASQSRPISLMKGTSCVLNSGFFSCWHSCSSMSQIVAKPGSLRIPASSIPAIAAAPAARCGDAVWRLLT